MAQVNFAKGEVQCKIVYYGPASSGKTANLRTVHERSPEHVRGKLTSIATDGERTLFFDYLPLNLGKVAGIRAKINIYAVPYLSGQNALRLLVLEGVDGIVFVADSTRARVDENREALENLRSNLAAVGRDLSEVPLVFQWNKADAEDAMSAEQMSQALDVADCECIPAAAISGSGVLTTLKAVTRQVLEHVSGMMTVRSAAAEQASDESRPAGRTAEPEPEAESETPEPVYRPSWHRQAPAEDTSTHSGIVAELAHRPLPGVQHGSRHAPENEPPPPTMMDDEPLELARSPAPDPESDAPPEPPGFILQKVDELKNQVRDAEMAGTWEDTPETDPTMRPEAAGRAFPAFGGGMAPVSHDPQDDEESRLVTVGGGGSRGNVRTIRQNKDSWDPENSPQPLRRSRGQPAKERRRRPRTQWRAHPPPLSQMAAGAAFALLWLAATGYLVKELL
jgi:signal recognition particle receptor subunit beta